jgi:hypothetical protein
MTRVAKWALVFVGFVSGVVASLALGRAWSPLCHESCLFSVGISMLVFLALLPFATAAIVAMGCAGADWRSRMKGVTIAMLLIALGLTVGGFLAQGHAHGG